MLANRVLFVIVILSIVIFQYLFFDEFGLDKPARASGEAFSLSAGLSLRMTSKSQATESQFTVSATQAK